MGAGPREESGVDGPLAEGLRPGYRPQRPFHGVFAEGHDSTEGRVGGHARGKMLGGFWLPAPAKQLGVLMVEAHVVRCKVAMSGPRGEQSPEGWPGGRELGWQSGAELDAQPGVLLGAVSPP